MKYKIAVITPIKKQDYLANTILDGLIQLSKEHDSLEFHISSSCRCSYEISSYRLKKRKFAAFAQDADLIFLIWGKKHNTDYDLANKINLWSKTIFIDGSEFGNNNRYDYRIQRSVLKRTEKIAGCIDEEMLGKCRFYCRREKPYLKEIMPLPFGIESRYIKYIKSNTKKDIDFVCIFGQDEYPLLRKYTVEVLVEFCEDHGFSYHINRTRNPDEFYDLLARAKVGISVGGGGFDTLRFWEILGNNCLLLTEHIDIFDRDSKELLYDNIYQFKNLFDFVYQLEKIGELLRGNYDEEKYYEIYKLILLNHSTKARVLSILNRAKEAALIK